MAGEALADVDTALALGSHPKPGKLEERRAKCVEALRAQQNGMNIHIMPRRLWKIICCGLHTCSATRGPYRVTHQDG